MFRYLVLGLLRDGVPRHGYALMKRYREGSGAQVSVGNFYRELQQLRARGLVRGVRNPSGADPRRLPYEITEAGAGVFDAWFRRPADVAGGEHQDHIAVRSFLIAETAAVGPEAVAEWEDGLLMQRRALERARAGSERPANGASAFNPLDLFLARRLEHVSVDLRFLGAFRAAYAEWTAARNNGERTVRARRRQG